MNRCTLFAMFVSASMLALPLGAQAQGKDAKAQKQAELRKMCNEALATLYKEKPNLKAEVAKSAGYGCFSSFGLTFLVGGAGGSGLVHNNATKKDTFMNMGQASVGVEIGVKDYREVLVFKDRKTLEKFVDSGWEFGGSGGAAAQAGGKGGEVGQAASAQAGIDVYPMTKTGLAAGGSATGRKYWKDKELN